MLAANIRILMFRTIIKWEIVGDIRYIIKPQNVEISVAHFKV
ncbi:MAG: hypothetical protein ACTSQP_05575 [Promethearchaeota archaeon]